MSTINNAHGGAIGEKSVCVIGGGAAGLMAAVMAAENGDSVTVFEKNPVCAKKLRITGKGRCNVTNNCSSAEVLQNVTRNYKFLYSAVNSFSPADTIAFFESCGVKLKTERGRRVFPVSDRADDIAEALINRAVSAGCRIIHKKVDGIITQGSHVAGVTAAGEKKYFDSVIVATGGVSYPRTGSTGDGWRFAEACGIRTNPPKPSLVPVVTAEKTSDMMGLTLKNVTLSVCSEKECVFSEMGELLITHFGLSGPLVLSASAHMTSDVRSYEMKIDLKPALDRKTLDQRLISDLAEYAQRDFINSLCDILPLKLVPYVIGKCGIPPRIKASAVTREMRTALLDTLKALPFTPVRFRPVEEAIITSGGVDVRELDPKTMMSKKIKNLYFVGEVIDVDAYTGGYNLQLAFSTATAAASRRWRNTNTL